ncbi:MAG: nuclear transport factor 2 family protein [Cyclobacteriaceae bacterium]|nr:nuclear transport factor 2 family protein [Cyclobacteriaceae bacterium]
MKHIIEKFYKAFENLDAEGMIACYHKEIEFEDPAFGIFRPPRLSQFKLQ